jgi:hypothetical protein
MYSDDRLIALAQGQLLRGGVNVISGDDQILDPCRID